MRPAKEKFGNKIKDLSKVIRNDENLLDAILIEDQTSYIAHDQKPCIYTIYVDFWSIKSDNKHSHALLKNATYFLLGIVRTYSQYSQLSLRSGIELILPKGPKLYNVQTQYSIFVREMICFGLNEVRKTYPEAILYGESSEEKFMGK